MVIENLDLLLLPTHIYLHQVVDFFKFYDAFSISGFHHFELPVSLSRLGGDLSRERAKA